MSVPETFEKQQNIIETQKEIIDELFYLLMQHITAEEAGSLPVVDKIKLVAECD